MPQLNKGGKFIFGFSLIRDNLLIQLPKEAVDEYQIMQDSAVILFTGSKSTGGFCVTSKRLLAKSKLQHILAACEGVSSYSIPPYVFIPFKGRSYCWAPLNSSGQIQLTMEAMNFLKLHTGNKLMCIRSSDIAFTMGLKGTLLERAHAYKGTIECF